MLAGNRLTGLYFIKSFTKIRMSGLYTAPTEQLISVKYIWLYNDLFGKFAVHSQTVLLIELIKLVFKSNFVKLNRYLFTD